MCLIKKIQARPPVSLTFQALFLSLKRPCTFKDIWSDLEAKCAIFE